MNPRYQQTRKSRQNCCHKFYPQPLFIPIFNLSHKRLTLAFTAENGYTLGSLRKIAHGGSHAEAGAFRMGVVSLPSIRAARSRISPGRVSDRRTLPLWELSQMRSRRTQKACGTAMRSCVSLSQGVAAPLGCVIFFPLSKLRLLRPIPETSFGFPDAPACAVPVQAASRLVPQRTLSAFQTESNPSDYTEVIN